MKRMNAIRRVVCCGLALLAGASVRAHACVCVKSEGFEADFRGASAVFAGRVVALEIAQHPSSEGPVEYMVATLRVEHRWKGPKNSTIRVSTCGTQQMLCTCGTDFQLGAHYVVFAGGEPLATGSCDRTLRFDRIDGDPKAQWIGAEELVKQLDGLDPRHGTRDGG
jgi:hypothetical protein